VRGIRRVGSGGDVEQRDLVVRAGQGDHDAFAVLVHGSITRLDAIACLILRDTELARDAVQEAFIRAWRDLPRLREPERFDAWLHRLTVNACMDASRVQRRRVHEVQLTPLIRHPRTGDGLAALADRDFLDRALRCLPPEQRALVVLRFHLDLTLPDAAETLGIPLGTAKSRLHRALETLRALTVAQDLPAAPVGVVERPA
jgi:RNA polymerase sigma-70 factor (ECF subfamily)